ncbi:hypothetical protein [Lentibacillus cibarius]|uniref:Uncharacterized protein n=1 Tax=Lentibacillus cibarius TaxID=2583219 RepID=A0A5S3R846_9BACI|nr:hypothetical protein [Lentibacillus cibarius]TMN23663.1 hypothetical protein FFL34_17310 [Lentibacillus cibarius]
MAFGVNRRELHEWKTQVKNGQIAFLTHFWIDERFPGCYTVTKVGCSDLGKLAEWGRAYQLNPDWIHRDKHFPHFDLFGDKQRQILKDEGKWEHMRRFRI